MSILFWLYSPVKVKKVSLNQFAGSEFLTLNPWPKVKGNLNFPACLHQEWTIYFSLFCYVLEEITPFLVSLRLRWFWPARTLLLCLGFWRPHVLSLERGTKMGLLIGQQSLYVLQRPGHAIPRVTFTSLWFSCSKQMLKVTIKWSPKWSNFFVSSQSLSDYLIYFVFFFNVFFKGQLLKSTHKSHSLPCHCL